MPPIFRCRRRSVTCGSLRSVLRLLGSAAFLECGVRQAGRSVFARKLNILFRRAAETVSGGRDTFAESRMSRHRECHGTEDGGADWGGARPCPNERTMRFANALPVRFGCRCVRRRYVTKGISEIPVLCMRFLGRRRRNFAGIFMTVFSDACRLFRLLPSFTLLPPFPVSPFLDFFRLFPVSSSLAVPLPSFRLFFSPGLFQPGRRPESRNEERKMRRRRR